MTDVNERQKAIFKALVDSHPEWTMRELPENITSKIAAAMIDCGRRGIDPVRIDPVTGDELLSRQGNFEAWHRYGSEPRQSLNVVVVDTKTGQVTDRLQNFSVAHSIACRRSEAERLGIEYKP